MPLHVKSVLGVGVGGVGVGPEESAVTMQGADPHATPAAAMLEVQQSSPFRPSPRSEQPLPPHVPHPACKYAVNRQDMLQTAVVHSSVGEAQSPGVRRFDIYKSHAGNTGKRSKVRKAWSLHSGTAHGIRWNDDP